MRLLLAPAAVLLILPLSGCLGGSGPFGPDEHIPDTWPSQGDARLQPGSRLYFSFGDFATQCTAGFMFRSADNATLYLAVTAHCLHPRDGSGASLGDKEVGDAVYDGPPRSSRKVGTIAYDGWAGGQETVGRDFALVALSNLEGIRDRAHPAVKEWDGPTGLADASTALPGQQVFAYGNSVGRQSAADNAKTGRLFVSDGEQLYVRLDTDAIQGDSGGPLLGWDGQALGLLHGELTFQAGGQPLPEGTDIFTPLRPAVERAQQDVPVSLVTWSFDGPATPIGGLPVAAEAAPASPPA